MSNANDRSGLLPPLACAVVLAAGLAACGDGPSDPAARFTEADQDFANPPDGQVNMRFVKQRDGAPAGRDRRVLEATFFPESEGWRVQGHEIVTPAEALVRIDVGDRVDLREEDDWPLADDTTVTPVWLFHLDIDAPARLPFVLMVGFGGPGEHTVRAVVVGDVVGVASTGADLSPHTNEPGLPPAFVIERQVPEANWPAYGAVHGCSIGRFGANAAYLHMPLPMEGNMHLTSWVQLPIAGGTNSGLQNDVRYFESGDIRVACDGMQMSVKIGGRETDWTAYPHTLWTIRMTVTPTPR